MPFHQEQTHTVAQQTALHTALEARQLHSLEFLTASIMELEQKITAEIQANPVLEAVTPENLNVQEMPMQENQPLSEYDYDENRDDFKDSIEKMLSDDHIIEFDVPASNNYSDAIQDMEDRRQYMFDSLTNPEPNLQQYLQNQLVYIDCPQKIRLVAEEIIGCIDDKGYLQTAEGDIAQSSSCSLETVAEALKLVQHLDPPGVGARSPEECLLLQLERQRIPLEPYRKLLLEYSEDLVLNRIPKIAKELGVEVDDINDMLDTLRKLNPYPGSAFSGNSAPYIYPEGTVYKREDGEYEVKANREHLPSFRISEKYLEMLNDPATPEETRKYLKEKILDGKQLEKSLDLRESTIMRIAKLLVSAQHDFLENGPAALHPLTQKEIADKMDVHETTISRAIANKYLQTPRGLIPFRDFFAGGYESEAGEDISVFGIKEIIREAVEQENPASPLSDSKIESILKSRGYAVARRTIAKYREELGIPSSQGRKVYTK